MSDSNIINVQFNIPRYTLGRPGSQFRACTGEMRVTPGTTEVFEFHYNNSDGVPLNLNGFKLRLVFYFQQAEYETLASNLQTNIVLGKDMTIEDPYSGHASVLLTDQQTLILGATGRHTLRWSVYMINSEDQAFATQITSGGERFGIAHIDRAEVPSTETILGMSLAQ